MNGLSILVPVYNRAVEELVRDLLLQAQDWPGPVEICCLDDASAPEYQVANRPLANWPLVRYQELPRNVGRAAIRNQLAALARHPWLLLLDNDSALPDAQFLARYAQAARQAPVVVGGTTYLPEPPTDAALRLHWHYGRQREARPAWLRQRRPYAQLTLNNILVEAQVFRRFPLDENLTRYGHEDTKFGWELEQARVPVCHLNNPVCHVGLEAAPNFLAKTRQAVRNLAQLYRAEGLGTDTRLLRSALRLRTLGLGVVFCLSFALLQRRVRHQLLTSGLANLRQLDALKLYWLLQELRRPLGLAATQTASPEETGGRNALRRAEVK